MNPVEPGAGGPVLVTGATGFLGREIVQRLLRRGREVHALARPESARGPLAKCNLEWHAGDLRDRSQVDRVFSEVAARARSAGSRTSVIHGAALISYRTRDGRLARETNVDGTAALLEAARRHGAGRLVHVSSVVTVGACSREQSLDETAPFNLGGLGVDYVDTKREAERLVLESADELDVVVVNPGAIFGPVERESNTVRMIRRVAEGRAPPFLPPGSVGVVGVEDAAVGTLLALERGRRGERYLLVESNRSTVDLLAQIARALGRPARGRVLPPSSWRILTRIASLWDRAFPMNLTPPQALVMLGLDLRFDAGKARRELGWRPRPFDEVIAETIAHLRARGEIGRQVGPLPPQSANAG